MVLVRLFRVVLLVCSARVSWSWQRTLQERADQETVLEGVSESTSKTARSQPRRRRRDGAMPSCSENEAEPVPEGCSCRNSAKKNSPCHKDDGLKRYCLSDGTCSDEVPCDNSGKTEVKSKCRCLDARQNRTVATCFGEPADAYCHPTGDCSRTQDWKQEELCCNRNYVHMQAYEVASWSECAKMCQGHDWCKFWTWQIHKTREKNECFLLEACTTFSPDNDCTSGSKNYDSVGDETTADTTPNTPSKTTITSTSTSTYTSTKTSTTMRTTTTTPTTTTTSKTTSKTTTQIRNTTTTTTTTTITTATTTTTFTPSTTSTTSPSSKTAKSITSTSDTTTTDTIRTGGVGLQDNLRTCTLRIYTDMKVPRNITLDDLNDPAYPFIGFAKRAIAAIFSEVHEEDVIHVHVSRVPGRDPLTRGRQLSSGNLVIDYVIFVTEQAQRQLEELTAGIDLEIFEKFKDVLSADLDEEDEEYSISHAFLKEPPQFAYRHVRIRGTPTLTTRAALASPVPVEDSIVIRDSSFATLNLGLIFGVLAGVLLFTATCAFIVFKTKLSRPFNAGHFPADSEKASADNNCSLQASTGSSVDFDHVLQRFKLPAFERQPRVWPVSRGHG